RVRDAVRFSARPVAISLSAIERRMADAAAAQDFELAQSLKNRLERATRGDKPTTAWRTTLDRFIVLGAFPSTRRGRARLFLCAAGAIQPWADVAGDISREGVDELIGPILSGASRLRPTRPLAPHECERLGLLTRHLYAPRRGAGGLVALDPPPESAALCTLIRRAAKVRDDSPDEEVVETQLGLHD
ncbi:MAG: UvrB/UvrC motif-containing protein, partial [Phycisphaerales bacterium JB059]